MAPTARFDGSVERFETSKASFKKYSSQLDALRIAHEETSLSRPCRRCDRRHRQGRNDIRSIVEAFIELASPNMHIGLGGVYGSHAFRGGNHNEQANVFTPASRRYF